VNKISKRKAKNSPGSSGRRQDGLSPDKGLYNTMTSRMHKALNLPEISIISAIYI
jgi:hypothetical protein